MTPFHNKYLHKTATKAASCFICYKETTSVLTTPGDFFYACPGHLKDVFFCSPESLSKESSKEEPVILGLNDTPVGKDGQQDSNSKSKDTDPKPQYYTLHGKIFYLRQRSHQERQMESDKLHLLSQMKSPPKN